MTKKEIIKKAKALFKDHAWVKCIYANGDYSLLNALFKVQFELNVFEGDTEWQIVDVVPGADPRATN